MKKKIIAANWKMNLDYTEGVNLVNKIIKDKPNLSSLQFIILAVPFPMLYPLKELITPYSNVQIAAQNVHQQLHGAYTGEISALLLKSLGINYVIIGHSERREYFNESNELLKQKIDQSLSQDLQPIFCCGESLTTRENNLQNPWVEQQLNDSLFHLSEKEITKIIIAYEPIWAIGTGKTATSMEAQDMHNHLRNVLTNRYGSTIAQQISILYGGSVKASNATELFKQPDIDGGLVGGASLIAEEFLSIVKSLK